MIRWIILAIVIALFMGGHMAQRHAYRVTNCIKHLTAVDGSYQRLGCTNLLGEQP